MSKPKVNSRDWGLLEWLLVATLCLLLLQVLGACWSQIVWGLDVRNWTFLDSVASWASEVLDPRAWGAWVWLLLNVMLVVALVVFRQVQLRRARRED